MVVWWMKKEIFRRSSNPTFSHAHWSVQRYHVNTGITGHIHTVALFWWSILLLYICLNTFWLPHPVCSFSPEPIGSYWRRSASSFKKPQLGRREEEGPGEQYKVFMFCLCCSYAALYMFLHLNGGLFTVQLGEVFVCYINMVIWHHKDSELECKRIKLPT